MCTARLTLSPTAMWSSYSIGELPVSANPGKLGYENYSTARNIDLSAWNLLLVPISHYGLWLLSGNTNVRSVYRLQAKNRSEGIPMPVPATHQGECRATSSNTTAAIST
jgi:hypothetical protein